MAIAVATRGIGAPVADDRLSLRDLRRVALEVAHVVEEAGESPRQLGRLLAALKRPGDGLATVLHAARIDVMTQLGFHHPQQCPMPGARHLCGHCSPHLVPWAELDDFEKSLARAQAVALVRDILRRGTDAPLPRPAGNGGGR